MARILLGWELGAGSGHRIKLARTAGELAVRGHECVFALPHLAAAPAGSQVWQAPLWPRQIAALARPPGAAAATMGDILARLGLGDTAALAAMLGAWDRILAAVRPDAVVAEYAPALMMAVRGRVPSVAVGTGFSLPPAHLPAFPSCTGKPAAHDEAALLGSVNAALAANGRPALAALPEIFASEHRVPAVFCELDPYREWRTEPYAAPSLSADVALPEAPGEELFVYLNEGAARANAFWQGLVDARVPTRVYDARLNAADKAVLRGAGLAVEDAPLPFATIAARSRLVMSHGGLGLTCAALLAGLPGLLLPFDIEKRMTAANVERLGLGRRVEFSGIEAAPFAAIVRETYHDAAMLARARAMAPGFQARVARTSEQDTADALDAVMGA